MGLAILGMLLLGALGWAIVFAAEGNFQLLGNAGFSGQVPVPYLAVAGLALLSGLFMIVRGLSRRPGRAREEHQRGLQNLHSAIEAEKEEHLLERRRLEDELLRVSDREEESRARAERLEEALTAARKQLEAAKQTGVGRSEDLEQELLNFLGIFQERGRFVDFLMEDITAYSNEQVAAGARIVHQGCAEVLREYFEIEAVFDGREGEQVALDESYSPTRFKLIGAPPERPPYRGKVLHRGWQAKAVKLPHRLIADPASRNGGTPDKIIAPAEVEVHAH